VLTASHVGVRRKNLDVVSRACEECISNDGNIRMTQCVLKTLRDMSPQEVPEVGFDINYKGIICGRTPSSHYHSVVPEYKKRLANDKDGVLPKLKSGMYFLLVLCPILTVTAKTTSHTYTCLLYLYHRWLPVSLKPSRFRGFGCSCWHCDVSEGLVAIRV